MKAKTRGGYSFSHNGSFTNGGFHQFKKPKIKALHYGGKRRMFLRVELQDQLFFDKILKLLKLGDQ